MSPQEDLQCFFLEVSLITVPTEECSSLRTLVATWGKGNLAFSLYSAHTSVLCELPYPEPQLTFHLRDQISGLQQQGVEVEVGDLNALHTAFTCL